MSGINPSIGSGFSNSNFFRRINQFQNQGQSQRVTISDLVQERIGEASQQQAESTDRAEETASPTDQPPPWPDG